MSGALLTTKLLMWTKTISFHVLSFYQKDQSKSIMFCKEIPQVISPCK